MRGLALAHAKFGKFPWKDVVLPAVELAEKGVLERSEIQGVLKTAKNCVNARYNSFCGPEAMTLMKSLCERFSKVPEEC